MYTDTGNGVWVKEFADGTKDYRKVIVIHGTTYYFYMYVPPDLKDSEIAARAGHGIVVPNLITVTTMDDANKMYHFKAVDYYSGRSGVSSITTPDDPTSAVLVQYSDGYPTHAIDYIFEVGKQITDRKISLDGASQSGLLFSCLLYTSPSPRDRQKSRMPSSA